MDQLSILDNAMLMKFRDNSAFSGKVGQSCGAFTNAGKNRQCRINTFISNKVDNALQIILNSSRPDNTSGTNKVPYSVTACYQF
jgi:hypothetical protein